MDYREIPKILSPGAYISQRSFLRGLLLERLNLEGLMRGEIYITKSAGLILERKCASQDRLDRKVMSVRFY